ncbi:MAG: nucleotidyltransferase domain-containing protein [Phycisphaerae bacterium]|nr:nucleotidyltransferase domain-containing protein [Phycisphaerae bacterium]
MPPAPTCPDRLHPAVWQALLAVAEQFAARGLSVFVFGSFATGTQHQASDLDVGFRRVHGTDTAAERDLRAAIDALPTIRQVDLVDFDRADPDFVRIASRHLIPLP